MQLTLHNLIRKYYPAFPEYGNCSRWVSSILLEANLVTTYFVFPKTVFINMFENYEKLNIGTKSNMSVVFYEQPENIKNLKYGTSEKPLYGEVIAPLQLFRNYFYNNLKPYANCIVTINPKSFTAVPILNPNPVQPSKIRNVVNNKFFIIGSIISSIMIYKKGFVFVNNIKNKYKNYMKYE